MMSTRLIFFCSQVLRYPFYSLPLISEVSLCICRCEFKKNDPAFSCFMFTHFITLRFTSAYFEILFRLILSVSFGVNASICYVIHNGYPRRHFYDLFAGSHSTRLSMENHSLFHSSSPGCILCPENTLA